MGIFRKSVEERLLYEFARQISSPVILGPPHVHKDT